MKILFINILLILSCVSSRHYIKVPKGVLDVAMCEIMKNEEDYYDKDIVLTGKVVAISHNLVELQCLHNSRHRIVIDTSTSAMKVENSGMKITAYGKLVLENESCGNMSSEK